jgi:hypothetical protein
MATSKIPESVKGDPIMQECWKRIYRQDRNVLAIFCGATGTRKSGSAISFCDNMDVSRDNKRRFNNTRIVFKAQDFIKLVQSNLPKGSAILWDEAGVDNDAREYYTKKNKLIKYVFQTFRYKNYLVVLTVPDLKSIDIGTRKLMHLYFEMYDSQSLPNHSAGKVEWIQTNPKEGKLYFKSPRFWGKDGIYRKLGTYYIPKPRPELELPYKQFKDVSASQWYSDFNKELDYMDEVLKVEKSSKVAPRDNLIKVESLIEENLPKFLHPSGNRVVADLVEKNFIENKIDYTSYLIKKAVNLINIRIKKGEISV